MTDPLTTEERVALENAYGDWMCAASLRGPLLPAPESLTNTDLVDLVGRCLAAVPRLAAGAGEREAAYRDIAWQAVSFARSECGAIRKYGSCSNCDGLRDKLTALDAAATPPDGGTKP